MGIESFFGKQEKKSETPEERLEKERGKLRREIDNLRAGADDRERNFEKIARARADLPPEQGPDNSVGKLDRRFQD